MSGSLIITVQGVPSTLEMFQKVSTRASDLRPVFRRPGLTTDFRRIMKERFYSEGAFMGTRWANLKPSTIALKQAMGYPPWILQRTLVMRKSFTTGFLGYRAMTRTSFFIGSNVDYVAPHMTGFVHIGGRQKTGQITLVPARPPWEWSPRVQKRWTSAIRRWIVNGVVSVGGPL